MPDAESRQLGLAVMGSLTAGLILWWMQSRVRFATFPYQDLIQLEVAAAIAQELPAGEDEFIWAAHDFVGQDILYEPVETEMRFLDGLVHCDRCVFPTEVLTSGRGNCLAKAALLVSILRNRLPADRVYVVVGYYAGDGIGGHAWAVVDRNATWYLLESTAPPRGWAEAETLVSLYVPGVLFNDQALLCQSREFCSRIEASDCRCTDLTHRAFPL